MSATVSDSTQPSNMRKLAPGSSLLLVLGALGSAGGCAETELVGPFFVTEPVTSAAAEEDYEYDAHAAGLQLPTTWSLVQGPVGMAIDMEGVVTWTPALVDMGDHVVEIEATDGVRIVAQTWDLSVHQDLLMGVTYSPKGHSMTSSGEDVIDFLTTSDPWGRLIAFNSPWRDSVADAGMVPEMAEFAMDFETHLGIESAVGIGWAAADGTADLLSDGDALDNSWSNQETRDEFLAMLTDYAGTYKPTYLFLGNEINSWYWTDPAGWSDWLSMWEECYDGIKAVSPLTMVFTVFQLERLKGLGAGTVGWTDPPHWNLVDDIVATGKLDAIGFTSYPYFEYATPGAIPADYYGEIAMHWDGIVIFTEIGWPATAAAPYPGGEMDQADFVSEFLGRVETVDVEYAVWRFLHDWDGQAATPEFTDTGFRDNDASVIRLSDPLWQTEVELRERPL
jgi:hypothetical protein